MLSRMIRSASGDLASGAKFIGLGSMLAALEVTDFASSLEKALPADAAETERERAGMLFNWKK